MNVNLAVEGMKRKMDSVFKTHFPRRLAGGLTCTAGGAEVSPSLGNDLKTSRSTVGIGRPGFGYRSSSILVYWLAFGVFSEPYLGIGSMSTWRIRLDFRDFSSVAYCLTSVPPYRTIIF